MPQKSVGHHFIADLFFKDAKSIYFASELRQVFKEVVKSSGLNQLNDYYHQFKPFGATGAIVLEESHICFHSWPEKKLLTMDIFTCGKKERAQKAFEKALELLKPASYKMKWGARGNEREFEKKNNVVAKGKS